MKKIFTLIAAAAMTLSLSAQELFKIELVEVEGQKAPNLSVGYGDDVTFGYHGDVDASYESYYTITGNKAQFMIHNGHGSKDAEMIKSGAFTLNNSGGSYAKVTLPDGVTLKTGDVIKLLGASAAGGAVNYDDSKKLSTDNIDASNEFTVGSDGEGKNFFIIWRGAAKPTFTGVLVERREGMTIAPAISIVGGKVVMKSDTEGASIYYGTSEGVTVENGTLYSEPLDITGTTTYYAVALKEGLTVSKEVSKVVEYYEMPSEATLSATLKALEILSDGDEDVNLESLVSSDGLYTATKVEEDAVLTNSAPWNNNTAFEGLVKVKKTITIATTDSRNIAGIKVIGISNGDGTTALVSAEGMKYTTDSNVLPARDLVSVPGVVELVAETPAKSFKVNFPAQARVKFEVYTVEGAVPGDVDSDGNVSMSDANAIVTYFLASDDDKTAMSDFNVAAADLTGEGEISMADANEVVTIFLGAGE